MVATLFLVAPWLFSILVLQEELKEHCCLGQAAA